MRKQISASDVLSDLSDRVDMNIADTQPFLESCIERDDLVGYEKHKHAIWLLNCFKRWIGDLEESTKKQPPIELYVVGQWVDTGPGYNDCIFEAGYVTSDLSKAKEAAGGTVGNHIMKASDGSYFHDWEQCEI